MKIPALCITYIVLLSGCAQHPERGAFSYSYAEVFTAAEAAVANHSEVEVDKATGVITTSWSAGKLTPKSQGILQDQSYVERVRYEIRVHMGSGSITVDVRAQLERRAPSGPRAIRWKRVSSQEYEKQLFNEIAMALEGEKR
ncbi:MAG: hypothetical protein QF645_00490 [Planctomycetota bacterium]|nr:hypothetical protein [Planctomycetota bacterium]